MAERVLELQTPAVAGRPRGGAAALEARLAALDLPPGGLTRAARTEARARLAAMGLPGPRDEYWRYTDPAPFNAARPEPLAIPARESALFADLDRLRLVFVDGRFDAAASDRPGPDEGIEITPLSLADAGEGRADWAGALYGRLEAAAQRPVPRPFAALNTLAATDGVLIRVTGRPARPVHILYCRADPAADVHLHHLLLLEPGAELTLLETGAAGARLNLVIEAELAQGARLHHVAAKRFDDDRRAIGHLFARLGAGAALKSFGLALNGRVMRQENVIELAGEGGTAHVAAAVTGDGAEGPFHHDDTVFVTHAAPRCESRQVFKKVLKNGAEGVFQGKILVRPGAQRTDGYQLSQALLLDEGSQFLAKPELEIHADDVKCSHGSTTGALDQTALFYLRSRGIPRDRAVVLLVLSFLADALAEIEDDRLREAVAGRLEDWLTGHAAG